MTVLGKPRNKWGWVRIAGSAGFIGVVAWTLLAAALRGFGEIAWMGWSGYQTFSFLNGIDWMILPLLVVLGAGWLEDQELKSETEQSNQREAELHAAAQRGEALKRVERAILAMRPDGAEIPADIRQKTSDAVRAVLVDLDEKGKGELLRFLHQKGWLTGTEPIDLSGADFTGSMLPEADLDEIHLENVNLTRAKMGKAQLIKSRFTGANLNKAVLRDADLREAVLSGCNLRGARLDDANLEGADLRNANLKGAHLIHANLKNCLLSHSPSAGTATEKADSGSSLDGLDLAILIDTIVPDGQKITNERGKEYLRKKEFNFLVDRL